MNTDDLIATFRTAITSYEKSQKLFEQVDDLTASDPEQAIAWSEVVKKREHVVRRLGEFFRCYSWSFAFGGSPLAWDKGLRELNTGHSLLLELELFAVTYSGQAKRLGAENVGPEIWSRCGQPIRTAAESVMRALNEQIREFYRVYPGM